jgi:hypothetical protein
MNPITGVSQTTTSGNCANPFTLTGGSSCVLTLEVNGSQLTGNLTSGPVVCISGSVLMCYQPSAADSLNVTLSASSSVATLQVLNTDVDLFNGGMNQTITVKNTSLDLTATNLTLSFAGTALAPFVTLVSNNCNSVAPQGTCQIIEGDTLHVSATSPTTVTATLQSADGNSEVVSVTATEYSVGDDYGENGVVASLDNSEELLNLVMYKLENFFGPYYFPSALGMPPTCDNARNVLDGKYNTDLIVACREPLTNVAANHCAALGSSNVTGFPYYLPAKNQMEAIVRNYNALTQVSVDTLYWASTIHPYADSTPNRVYIVDIDIDGNVRSIEDTIIHEYQFRCVHTLPTT